MSETGSITKIMSALVSAKESHTGIALDYFQVIEVYGYIRSLEEEINDIRYNDFVGDSDHEHDDRIL